MAQPLLLRASYDQKRRSAMTPVDSKEGEIFMVDFIITATVTRSGSIFTWAYSLSDGMGNPVKDPIEVAKGAKKSMVINLVPVGGLSCKFAPNPLSFYNWKGAPVGIPLWLQNLQNTVPSTLTFDDYNTNIKRRSYHFVINAVFDQVSITSPDPTIVNVGTEGIMAIHFPEPSLQSPPAQPEAMAVAV